jgi:hypothetical protein
MHGELTRSRSPLIANEYMRRKGTTTSRDMNKNRLHEMLAHFFTDPGDDSPQQQPAESPKLLATVK